MSIFEAIPLSPALGAEVRGLDTTSPLDADGRRELRELFDTHSALLFRGVTLDRPYQQYLSELVIGEEDLAEARIAAHAEREKSFYISNRIEGAAAPFGRLMYHSDGMWSDSPFEVISLYGEEVVPPVPGTLFASTVRAWETLPDTLRAQVEGRTAVHMPGPESFTHRGRKGTEEGGLVQPKRDREYSIEIPIAHRHPRTGRTILYVSQQMTSHIVGLSPEASEALIEQLFEHLYAPQNVWQHEWLEGDLLLWDNLALQHARPDVKTEENARTLRKVGWPLPATPAGQVVASYERLD